MKTTKVYNELLNQNSYIIELNETSIIIDPGSNIFEHIKNINNTHKIIVFLTHGHIYHIIGLNEIVNEFDPIVYISKIEEKLLKNNDLNCANLFLNSFKLISMNLEFFKDKFSIENSIIKVIETPGHTKGSVSILFDDIHLFTGDTLMDCAIGRCDLPTGSLIDMKSSLRKISKLDSNLLIYPGHGENTILINQLNFISNILTES